MMRTFSKRRNLFVEGQTWMLAHPRSPVDLQIRWESGSTQAKKRSWEQQACKEWFSQICRLYDNIAHLEGPGAALSFGHMLLDMSKGRESWRKAPRNQSLGHCWCRLIRRLRDAQRACVTGPRSCSAGHRAGQDRSIVTFFPKMETCHTFAPVFKSDRW